MPHGTRKFEDRIALNMIRQADRDRQFHQILQDVTLLKRNAADVLVVSYCLFAANKPSELE